MAPRKVRSCYRVRRGAWRKLGWAALVARRPLGAGSVGCWLETVGLVGGGLGFVLAPILALAAPVVRFAQGRAPAVVDVEHGDARSNITRSWVPSPDTSSRERHGREQLPPHHFTGQHGRRLHAVVGLVVDQTQQSLINLSGQIARVRAPVWHRLTTASPENAVCSLVQGQRQCKQLWVAAIDRDEQANGTADPSRAPFWIPGQTLTAQYVSPQWTTAVIPPPR